MRGKGGSMHLTSVKHNMMGSYAIIGAHLTIANGAAWSAQYRGTEQVAVCFFGDGTTNIGAFHEALNFAVIWKLPVVFVCENNLYMEYTSIHDVTAVEHPAADRACAYGLEPVLIDGNDVDVVYRTAQRALDARAQRRRPEPDRSRDLPPRRPLARRPRQVPARRGSRKRGSAKDPLPRYRTRLLEMGISAADIEKIEAETNAAIDQATEIARNAPPPPLELADKDVWADGGSAWRN